MLRSLYTSFTLSTIIKLFLSILRSRRSTEVPCLSYHSLFCFIFRISTSIFFYSYVCVTMSVLVQRYIQSTAISAMKLDIAEMAVLLTLLPAAIRHSTSISYLLTLLNILAKYTSCSLITYIYTSSTSIINPYFKKKQLHSFGGFQRALTLPVEIILI